VNFGLTFSEEVRRTEIEKMLEEEEQILKALTKDTKLQSVAER
jgi:hypothetical protein